MEDYNDTAAVAAEEAETASGEPNGSEKKHKRKLTAREKGKIALIVLGSFFGLIALLTVILAPIIVEGNKVITRDSAEPNDALTEWMSYISDDAPVTRLAIPGSHDSGCSGMPWYAETQDLNFAEQLARGVRYFDIRVNKKGGDLVIFHGPVNGTDYVELLYQIDEFMDAHPSEFLILDFSHFKNDSESEVFRLFDEIVSAERVVNDTCMTDSEYLDSLTLGDVRGKCVVFVDPEETEFCCRDYLFFKMGDEVEAGQEDLFSLVSPYKKLWNGSSAKKFTDKILDRYIDTFKGIDSGFFVLQCQLTDNALVFGPRYREGKLIKRANDFVRALYDNAEDLPYINIIMRDFVTCEKTALIVGLNIAKGWVSGEKAESFAASLAEFTDAI